MRSTCGTYCTTYCIRRKGVSSEEKVDEEVDGGVGGDEEVRNVLHNEESEGPVVVVGAVRTVVGLVGGGQQLPGVAEDEEPHDEDGDACEPALLGAVGGRAGPHLAPLTQLVSLRWVQGEGGGQAAVCRAQGGERGPGGLARVVGVAPESVVLAAEMRGRGKKVSVGARDDEKNQFPSISSRFLISVGPENVCMQVIAAPETEREYRKEGRRIVQYIVLVVLT